MLSRAVAALAVLVTLSLSTAVAAPVPANAAGEYAKHFTALSQLSVAVAQAMPPDQYGFRPHPESMDFGQLMSHIATTQLDAAHDSPDGHLPGREVLLAMYVHVAHHRGQAEIYLRDKGIRPPSYRI
jgi:hypothetical protein